ncbi:MAG: hypothetical protein LBQ24_00970 [Candidatus Peribacteria bacterium]|jgi:type II secretory pathway pseudopilin PulG|nr:hypothetical protein [Candidatus Peribacteria bacterium]
MSSLKIGLMEIFKKSSQSPLLRGSNSKFPLDKGGKGDFQAFTLVEIIIIVVILAIL